MQYDERIIKLLLKNARYKREYFFDFVSVILTLAVNVLLIYASNSLRTNPELIEIISVFTGVDVDFIKQLSIFNGYAIIVLLLIIAVLICFYNISYQISAGLKNFSIDVMPDKESYVLYEKYCKLLDIEMPILFINSGVYDSTIFGVKIRGTKAIGISVKAYQEVLRRKDYHTFNYQVTTTLGSIYLGHYSLLFQLFTFWARIIPFYSKFYSRTLSYSTDRVAQILIGTHPLITSIARETSGIDSFDDEYVEELLDPKAITMTRLQRYIALVYSARGEYPLPYFRIMKIIENDEKDKILFDCLNDYTENDKEKN